MENNVAEALLVICNVPRQLKLSALVDEIEESLGNEDSVVGIEWVPKSDTSAGKNAQLKLKNEECTYRPKYLYVD